MSKNIHCLLLLIFLLNLTGCETVKGAATGFGQDVNNISDPDKNGWNAVKHADEWMQQNLW